MANKTRKERIAGNKKKKTTNSLDRLATQKNSANAKETSVEITTGPTKVDEKKSMDWNGMHKKIKQKTKELYLKMSAEIKKMSTQIKQGAKKRKEEQDAIKNKRREKREKELAAKKDAEKNLRCRVGYPLHQQKFEYGKGTIEFTFGGYYNDHTIAIVVESTLGVRAHSSVYTFQVEKGTEIHMPGLYKDGTTEFKEVVLKVMDLDPKNNTIHFEKNEIKKS